MATEEWIQESLARLESLEEERKRHEDALETDSDPSTLRMHTQAIDRLEVKIRALYAELEAVAAQDNDASDSDVEDDDGDDDVSDEDFAPAPVVAVTPAAPVAAPFASAPAAAPFASAPVAAPFASEPAATPFGDAPSTSPFGSPASESPAFSTPSFSSAASTFDDSDSDSGGSGSKVGIIIAIVLVLGGAGAYFAFGRTPAVEAPPPAAPTEVKVIKSGEVPPDTQGPRTAKGGDIDVAHGAQIKETERRAAAGGGSSSPATSEAPKKKKEDKATKIEKTDDPLGGIR